jgi:hypothetical protein
MNSDWVGEAYANMVSSIRVTYVNIYTLSSELAELLIDLANRETR